MEHFVSLLLLGLLSVVSYSGVHLHTAGTAQETRMCRCDEFGQCGHLRGGGNQYFSNYGLIRYSETSFTVSPFVSVAPAWPPRTARDLLLLLQGVDPHCFGTSQTTTASVTLPRWRQLLGSLPQLFVGGRSRDWLQGALKTFLNAGSNQGDLKRLLLWGTSQNLSWGFLDMPLVSPPPAKSQVLGATLKADLPTFLQICSDRLLPALKSTCKSMNDSISDSLQSVCLLLTPAPQTAQMDTQLCRLFFSLLSDLLTDPCNTRPVRAVRSVAVSCAYATWYNSSTISPSDVSTCSESDRQQFISSVCGDQKLLNQLASQSENNWLQGFCAYNTNPENMCHYVSWEGTTVSVFSLAYCWLYDQDQFTLFLCTNPNLLNQLKQNPDSHWLDPTCATVAPTNIDTPSIIQELCNYEQWQLETMNPSSVAFCAETDKDGFTNYVCKSPGVLQQLLIYETNSWVVGLCDNITSMGSENNCNYSLWQEIDHGNQSVLIVAPPVIVNCSQVDETLFVSSVCNNPSLLLTLTKDTNNSWVLQFCIYRICNYTTWNSTAPEPKDVDFCWLFDQKQLELYLCSYRNVFQQINLNITSDLSCPANNTNTTVCSYSLWSLTAISSSMLSYCAVQDAFHFHQYICGNSSLVMQLTSNTENSWIPVFCNGKVSSNITNCTESLLNVFSSSCPDCNKTELDEIDFSVCADQNLTWVLDLFWNSSAFINKFIIWNFCNYSSWGLVNPLPFLVSYCWKFDNTTFTEFLCSNFELYYKLSQDTAFVQVSPSCLTSNICNYSAWDLATLQNSSVQYCAEWDAHNFTQNICTNSSMIKIVTENKNISWVTSLCFSSGLPSEELDPCAYVKWLPGSEGWTGPIDFSTVYLCSKNDTLNFMMAVCNNSWILSGMSEALTLTWTLSFCYKLSDSNVLSQILVWDVCDYSATTALTPLLVEFCWLYDQENFSHYLCSNYSLYTLMKAQPQHFWLQPVCTPPIPASPTGMLNFSLVQCDYQQSDSTHLDISLIRYCAEHDQEKFLNTFCNATMSQQVNGGCSCGNKLCSYYSWHGANIHPMVVKACWATDQLNFITGMCMDSSLLAALLLDSTNSWLRPVCRSQNEDQMVELVNVVCRYGEWGKIHSVPGTIIALCKTYHQDMYLHSNCDRQQGAVCNYSIGPRWDQNHDCDYASWENGATAPDKVVMCWVLEKENFTAHVCSRLNLLSKLSNDSRTSWVTYICSIISTLNESAVCLSEDDKKQLQWNCSADLSLVCPANGLTVSSFLPLSVCYLQNAGFTLPTTGITTLYTQVVDAAVIILLLLDEMQIMSLSGTYEIWAQIVHSVLNFTAKEILNNDQKTEFLQTFGNTLILLIGEQATSQYWILIEQLFNLTLSDLKVLISSLHPKAAKVFLNILSQNWTSLQVPDDYFSMIVSTLLTVQATSDPLLFCDAVPFLRYLEPDEIIRLLPPLQDNKEVLQALGQYAESLSDDQRIALGSWLRRTTVFENITQLNHSFIQRVGNLLPLLSLDVFVQLNVQQVVNILPFLPVALSPPYQRIVASRVLQVSNVTVQDVELMGLSVCQAAVQDLERYRQNVDIFLVLKRNLFQCVRRGDLFPDSKMLDFLIGDLHWQDPTTLNWESISNLSMVIPALGYSFLQTLRPEQLLPALSDVGSVTLTSAQARELVQKILSNGNVSDEVLSHVGSLVLGFSPMFLQQLSTNQLTQLLPALTNHASSLTYAQTLAAIRTLWASWNVTHKFNELGPLLYSLPLILLRTRSKEIVSDLSSVAGVKWNQQQALLLFREATQMVQVQGGVRSTGNSMIGTNCDSLKNFLQDDFIQTMKQFRDIIYSLPRQLVRCVLDKILTLPPTPQLLKSLSSQHITEIQPSTVSILPVKSCRYVLDILKLEAQYVIDLPQQRRSALLDGLTRCLRSAGVTSPLEQSVALGALTPFLRGPAFLSVSSGLIRENVEHVINYCYPQETQLLLSQLLEEPKGFGSPTLWMSLLLERLDRLVPLLTVHSLQSLNTMSLLSHPVSWSVYQIACPSLDISFLIYTSTFKAALSSCWVKQILSEERKWRKSLLGTACRQAESTGQRAEGTLKQRTLLQRSYLACSQPRISALVPECGLLRGSIVSAWGVDVLLRMKPVDFMDCLEEIGQDPDIPTSELAPLLGRVLKIAGPVSVLSTSVLSRLGRLATQFNEQQLKEVSLADLQVMEAFGKEQEWTMSQLKTLVSGFLQSQSITAQDLDALYLVTLGYIICGLPEKDMGHIRQLEFCLAVMYLGQLALHCTEQQLHVLTQLCTNSNMFGPISGWTEDIFREIGSVAAGLQDIELSALVQEQIQGFTPLAISLIQPKKFAVSFSAQQLQMFSWSQATAVTEWQRKLLDKEQLRALTLALIDNGNQTYRAGKSHAGLCMLCTMLHLCTVLPVMHVLYIV